ncbi:MAG: PrsW family intramembrane metalloprotease, partial [Clostridia bacterium]|nr:PrsW family intramembrane metalloprotease [Clostridia bacterium]
NVLVLRLTNNMLYVPSVTFLGGVTFTVPFIILLYELYPKRDIGLFVLLAALVVGGTASGVLCQLAYSFIKGGNGWVGAVVTGLVEEICKAIPAMIAIIFFRQKNPYACYIIAAAVGAGFSVIEDMGYIFYYSDKYIAFYSSDIQATVALFVDRGFSSFCTHILWTGAIGWAYCYIKNPFRSFRFFLMIFVSIGLHICWDLPIEGWWQVLDIAACVIVAASISISIVHLSRVKTLAAEMDLTAFNEDIIREAKAMGQRMRFTNAANLTFCLGATFLSVLALLFCAMPIGMDYKQVDFTKQEFIDFLQGGKLFKANEKRLYNPNVKNYEERYTYDDNDELTLTYAIQIQKSGVYEYYYGYSFERDITLDDIWVDAYPDPDNFMLVKLNYYEFENEMVGVFDINGGDILFYSYNSSTDTVTAVTDAEEFEGYEALVAICAAGCAVTVGCSIVLISLRIKIRRLKDEGL